MSEQVNWKELNDREKTRLVIGHVLGYFIMPDGACKRGKLEITNPVPEGFHWPIAYWNDDGEWWFTQDITTHQTPVDPLRDMNDAFLVWEKMKGTDWSAFCFELDGVLTQHRREWNLVTKIPYITWFEQFLDRFNAEGICVAALRTAGIGIIL